MSTRGVDAPYSNEIWSVIPRLSAMRSNCSMVGLSFPQLILFRYCLVQPNLLASSASLMHFSTNAFFKSIFVSFFIFLAFGRGTPKARQEKRILPKISGSILSNLVLFKMRCVCHTMCFALFGLLIKALLYDCCVVLNLGSIMIYRASRQLPFRSSAAYILGWWISHRYLRSFFIGLPNRAKVHSTSYTQF